MINKTLTNTTSKFDTYAQKPLLIPSVAPNIGRILGSGNILSNANPLSQPLLPGSLANNPLASQANNQTASAGTSQAAWTSAGGCGCGSKGCGGTNSGDRTGAAGQPNSGANSPANNPSVDQSARDNVIQNPRNLNTP